MSDFPVESTILHTSSFTCYMNLHLNRVMLVLVCACGSQGIVAGIAGIKELLLALGIVAGIAGVLLLLS